jgi:hypothetical protein
LSEEIEWMGKKFQPRLSRRAALQAGIAVMVAGSAPSAPAQTQPEAEPQEKVDQKLVEYQKTPKDGQMCMICVHYVAPNACKLVAGKISPTGWCQLFGPKPS